MRITDRIRVEAHDRRGRIVLDAGPLNILTTADVHALAGALRELDACAVVVMESASARAFCAGMDVADHRPAVAVRMLDALTDLTRAFASAKPVSVARVNGPALGGGLELMLLCDLAIASTSATFALPEVKLAALPPIAAEFLPRAVGERRALDLILTGRTIKAQQALEWGLLTSAVAPDELDAVGETLMAQLLDLSPPALRACKRALRARDVAAALGIYRHELLPTHDAAEGVSAFLEKRAPVWEHMRREVEVSQ